MRLSGEFPLSGLFLWWIVNTPNPPVAEIDLDGFSAANPAGAPPAPSESSVNRQLYENSSLSGSSCEADAESNPARFFNARPPNLAILHEKAEHRIIIMLKAQGKSNREIARVVGNTEAWISQVLRQPWARERLVEEITLAGRDSVNEILRGEVENTIFKLIEVRDTATKQSDAIAASKEILDRFLGKPTQHIKTEQVKGRAADMEGVERELQELDREIGRLTGGAASTASS